MRSFEESLKVGRADECQREFRAQRRKKGDGLPKNQKTPPDWGGVSLDIVERNIKRA